eukprot:scaffold360_cov334-Prasinococcus_capsulatus_cf.AAC.9
MSPGRTTMGDRPSSQRAVFAKHPCALLIPRASRRVGVPRYLTATRSQPGKCTQPWLRRAYAKCSGGRAGA